MDETTTVPIPDFQTMIQENELWVACDDNWKQYHHWLMHDAFCVDCGRMWKDRPRNDLGDHIDVPWTCEVRCGCFARGDFSQARVHLSSNRVRVS